MSWPWPGEQDGGGGGKWGGGGGAGARQRLGKQAVAVLVDWQDKGPKSFGWLSPICGMPTQLEEAKYHGGDVYVSWKDIQDPRPGALYTFWPYTDKQGLGAEECILRAVVRFIVPAASASKLRLPPNEMNPCTTYLSSSVFYPELEEAHGVTLRKYLWDCPFTVLEIWGQPQNIVAAAEAIGLLAHVEAEVLVSRNMAKQEAPDRLRDLGEEDVPNVPVRFRVALSLGTSESERRDRLGSFLSA